MSRAAQKMTEISHVLNGVAARWQRRHGGELPPGACVHESVDRRTPFDELADKEEREGLREPAAMPLFDGITDRATPFDDLDEHELKLRDDRAEAMLMYVEAQAWLLDFLFAEGPHPAVVMRRLYAWIKKFRPDKIWDMGYRQLGMLLGESSGTMEWRIGQIIDDYARAKGVHGVLMPWQRTAEACQSYSDAQQENSNRTGGKRSSKHKTKAKKK